MNGTEKNELEKLIGLWQEHMANNGQDIDLAIRSGLQSFHATLIISGFLDNNFEVDFKSGVSVQITFQSHRTHMEPHSITDPIEVKLVDDMIKRRMAIMQSKGIAMDFTSMRENLLHCSVLKMTKLLANTSEDIDWSSGWETIAKIGNCSDLTKVVETVIAAWQEMRRYIIISENPSDSVDITNEEL